MKTIDTAARLQNAADDRRSDSDVIREVMRMKLKRLYDPTERTAKIGMAIHNARLLAQKPKS